MTLFVFCNSHLSLPPTPPCPLQYTPEWRGHVLAHLPFYTILVRVRGRTRCVFPPCLFLVLIDAHELPATRPLLPPLPNSHHLRFSHH